VLLKQTLYLFGGLAAGPSRELWAYSLLTGRWSPVIAEAGNAPAPRLSHTMSWDGKHSLFVIGGQAAGCQVQDTSRANHGLTVRTVSKRTCYNDCFRYALGGQYKTLATPKSIMIRSLIVLLRFCYLSNAAALRSACSYNTEKNTWQEHYYVGMRPSPRRGHSCTFLANRKPAIAAPVAPVPERYLPCSKPLAAAAAVVATCAPQYSSRELIVIGGAAPDAVFGTETVFAQVWALDLDSGSWQELSAPGPAPPAVFGHTATLLRSSGSSTSSSSAAGSCGTIVVIGGIGLEGLAATSSTDAAVAAQQQQHIHLLDLSTLVWSQLQLHPLSFNVPPLQGHTAVEDPCCPGRLLVFGGRNCSNSNNNYSSSSDSAEAEQAELYTLQGTLWSRALLHDAPAAALLHNSCHKRRSGHVCCAWQPSSSSKGLPAALARPCVLVVGGCSEGGGLVSGQVHALCDAPAAKLRPVSAISALAAATATTTAAAGSRTIESSTDLWEHMRSKMHSVQAWQSGRYTYSHTAICDACAECSRDC
jgi:Galactose oxidase, central domain